MICSILGPPLGHPLASSASQTMFHIGPASQTYISASPSQTTARQKQDSQSAAVCATSSVSTQNCQALAVAVCVFCSGERPQQGLAKEVCGEIRRARHGPAASSTHPNKVWLPTTTLAAHSPLLPSHFPFLCPCCRESPLAAASLLCLLAVCPCRPRSPNLFDPAFSKRTPKNHGCRRLPAVAVLAGCCCLPGRHALCWRRIHQIRVPRCWH